MFDVEQSLRPAMQRAQHHLAQSASALARANATSGPIDAAMTATARSALFAQALMGAVHARLAEIKAATK